jgi:phospholipase/carboxylesterase
MLVLLHGIDSNEQELLDLTASFDPRFYTLSLQAPTKLAPNSFGWYEMAFAPSGQRLDPAQVEESRRKLTDFLKLAPNHYQADPDQLYLFGFGQGATMALTLLLTSPEWLRGVVSVSGHLLPQLIQANTPLSGKLAGERALGGKVLFLGHGENDQVIPLTMARQLESVIRRSPVEYTYREYQMGHEIGPKCLREVDLWLRTQLGTTRSERA